LPLDNDTLDDVASSRLWRVCLMLWWMALALLDDGAVLDFDPSLLAASLLILFVTTGQVGFIEKRVSDGPHTLTILIEIEEVYSLFVVGKRRGDCPMTVRMKDLEECPELGTVGDFLASSLDVNASVLVIQRQIHSNDNLLDN
ncbi:unnamed protein product, partial [Eruca vesicaria subsp. sativa]|nr:unnamed protein product [Eruca vesicaria subsp. sativa]